MAPPSRQGIGQLFGEIEQIEKFQLSGVFEGVEDAGMDQQHVAGVQRRAATIGPVQRISRRENQRDLGKAVIMKTHFHIVAAQDVFAPDFQLFAVRHFLKQIAEHFTYSPFLKSI